MWSRSGAVMLFQNRVAWLVMVVEGFGPLAHDRSPHVAGDVTPCPERRHGTGSRRRRVGRVRRHPLVDDLLAEAVALGWC